MTLVGRIALLATLLVASFQAIHGLAQYCESGADYCITITPPGPEDESHMTFLMNASASVGWMAVGIGDSMIGSYMVIAWPTSSGGFVLSQREATTHSVPKVGNSEQQDALEFNNAVSGISGGRAIVEFKRPLTVPGSTISADTRNFIYAMCNTRPQENNYTTTNLRIHDYKGVFALNLRTGEALSAPKKYQRLLAAHGVVMFLGWALTLPTAAAIVRFGRNILSKWFHLHWGIQVFVTTPLVIAGFVLAYYGKQKQFDPNVKHQVSGVFLIAALGMQIILGMIHHALFDRNRQYIPWWTKVHWWWGRLIFLVALVQIPMGMHLYKKSYNLSYGVFISYYVYISLLVSAYVLGLVVRWFRGRQNPPYSGVADRNNGSPTSSA